MSEPKESERPRDPQERGLTRVAVYERTLPTSVERVWENVRDWEHLPWLHSSSFSSIECSEEGAWGWRARIGAHGEGNEFLLELVIDAAESRYVSRTLDGGTAGTEIWTRVEERGTDASHVVVEFWLPGVDPSRTEALGDLYLELYARLWDEDESMMVRRTEELSATRSGSRQIDPSAGGTSKLCLGSLRELREQLPRVVRRGGRVFRIVELDGTLVAHAAVCPHRLGPLDEVEVRAGRITCPWHGYEFDIVSGRECQGRPLRLPAAPRIEVDSDQQVWLQ